MWRAPAVVLWMDICIVLPLTTLFNCCVRWAEQRDRCPVIYYRNLLVSNLIQLCIMIFWGAVLNDYSWCIVYCCGAMANIYLKMCIALERYFFITRPQLDCFRQTRGSLLACALVWTLCGVSVALAISLEEPLCLIIYAALPAPLFTLCLAGTLRALPAASLVHAEEKRRTVGTLILLLLLLLLSGPIDRLLACLCCCSMENSSNTDVTDVSTERQVYVAETETVSITFSQPGRVQHELAGATSMA